MFSWLGISKGEGARGMLISKFLFRHLGWHSVHFWISRHPDLVIYMVWVVLNHQKPTYMLVDILLCVCTSYTFGQL